MVGPLKVQAKKNVKIIGPLKVQAKKKCESRYKGTIQKQK